MSEENTTPTTSTTTSITDKDVLLLHWENYKMRQSHIWRSLNMLIFAVVTLIAIPYIKPTLFDNKPIIFFLSFVALGLSVAGRRLLKAEYCRLQIVIDKFKEMTPPHYRPNFNTGIIINGKVIKAEPGQIGRIMLGEICGGLIAISIINFLIIIGIYSDILKHPS